MEIESDYFIKVKVPGAKILDIKHNIFNVMAQENNYFFNIYISNLPLAREKIS